MHSHAVKNEAEGLADLDGSGNLYFHKGERGNHPGWDSKLFDYRDLLWVDAPVVPRLLKL